MTFPEYTVILLSYLLGSIPFGLLLARLAGLGDITKQGSGNIGATNVTRVGGKKLGLITLLLDAGKGVLAVYLTSLFFSGNIVIMAAGASVFGHIFPVWLKFKGGKGVATTLAVLLAVVWPVGLFACGVWLVTFFIGRISSLAALVSMALSPLFAVLFAPIPVVILTFFLSVLVIFRHKANIIRLLDGTEKQPSLKK